MLTLKDLIEKLPSEWYNYIQVREFDSFGDDILFGYCKYENGELISVDGDDYSLEDWICEFKITADEKNNPVLVVWIPTEWEESDGEKVVMSNRYDAQMRKLKLAINGHD